MKTWARLIVASLFLLAGCNDESSPKTGQLQVGITDAAGDFYSYSVDVTSVALKRADGAMIETLPTVTRVDFAEYVELAELFTIRTVPSGTYTGLRLTLDYGNAQILVENGAGNPAAVSAVNQAGAPLATQTVDVNFGPRDRLTVLPGVPAHVLLDFDLAASNQVDDASNPTKVTVLPVLFADAHLNDDRPYRLRGLVEAVSLAENQFRLDLRPFDRRAGDFGKVNVNVTGATHYEISGQHYVGAPGLQALAALNLPAPAAVVGQFDRASRRFFAARVFAGTAERGAADDFVRGHVVARNGNTLIVLGALVDRDEDRAAFSRTITVDLHGSTTVFKEATGIASIGDVSVGQKIDVLGDHDTGTGDAMHMDARYVRLRYTDLAATVVQVSPLVLDLQAFDRVPAARFNFTGAGTSGNDANPDQYEVDTGSLALDGLAAGAPVRVRGFVAPFGDAPPDFAAITVLNAAQMPAALGINWKFPGSSAAFPALEAGQIVVDLQNPDLGVLHHVRRGGVFTDLTALGGDLTVVPAELGRYAIASRGSITVFGNFADFSAALATRMAGGERAWVLGAGGRFDDASVTFTAPGAAVILTPPG